MNQRMISHFGIILRQMSRRCELYFSSLTLSEVNSIEVDWSAYMQNMQMLLQITGVWLPLISRNYERLLTGSEL